jgi:hypothetical protein
MLETLLGVLALAAWAAQKQMEQRTLKKVNNCLNTNIYFYLETSGACVIKLITAVIYLDPMVKP